MQDVSFLFFAADLRKLSKAQEVTSNPGGLTCAMYTVPSGSVVDALTCSLVSLAPTASGTVSCVTLLPFWLSATCK